MKGRTWFRIHSFTGVITGLLLFVICFSGTFATLAHEIDWLVTPMARVSPQASEASWGEIARAVRQSYPDAELRSLHAPLYSQAAAEVIIEPPHQSRRRVFVDPYTAEVLGSSSYVDVWRFFRSFHRRLFLPNPVGIYIVSIFAVTLLVSLVAALNFYKRWWRRFLRFRPGRGRALWSELHKTGGLWTLWFALLMAVTGIWYGLEATGAPDALLAPERDRPEASVTAGDHRPVDTLVAAAREARPEIDIRVVYPPGSFFGPDRLRVAGQAADWLVRDRVNHVSVAADGTVIANRSGHDLTAYEYWVNMADPLHFGDFGGLVSKLIWFVFGLALCALVLTGTWLHASRLARESPGHTRAYWPGTLAACAVSVAVVAASIPYGLGEVQGYGPTIDDVQRLPDLVPGVAAVIFGWIALTLAIIGFWIALLWRHSPHPQSTHRTARDGNPA